MTNPADTAFGLAGSRVWSFTRPPTDDIGDDGDQAWVFGTQYVKSDGAWSAQGGTSGQTVQWVDLGLIDLVTATMNGPQTLYNMPAGSFLSSIRFTDDPSTVVPDSLWGFFDGFNNLAITGLVIGTVKSFGWYGFASIDGDTGSEEVRDTTAIQVNTNGYGPFAALDTGIADDKGLVLSAAAVGPIEIGVGITGNSAGNGVRVAAITNWVATTAYQSPLSNTNATPGALQKCMITANGTIWVNAGASGTSGGSAPDFAGNAGGHVADGASIVWYDTGKAVPTQGKIHAVAEIITLTAP
jgi:hypothetical protein